MSGAARGWAHAAALGAWIVAAAMSFGCGGRSTPPPIDSGIPADSASQQGIVWGPPDSLAVTEPRSIETVLADAAPRLMAIPGVVGTYQTEDSRGRAVIGVLVSELSPELRRQIPTKIESFPVWVEVTDEIRPLPDSL